MISRAIRAHNASPSRRDPRWVPGLVESGRHQLTDSGGLTASERALQRALYHDFRIHKPKKSSAGPWSLQVQWLGRIGARRLVRIRVFADTSGRRHIKAGPASESWAQNPALQSGGIGSGKERFPA